MGGGRPAGRFYAGIFLVTSEDLDACEMQVHHFGSIDGWVGHVSPRAEGAASQEGSLERLEPAAR